MFYTLFLLGGWQDRCCVALLPWLPPSWRLALCSGQTWPLLSHLRHSACLQDGTDVPLRCVPGENADHHVLTYRWWKEFMHHQLSYAADYDHLNWLPTIFKHIFSRESYLEWTWVNLNLDPGAAQHRGVWPFHLGWGGRKLREDNSIEIQPVGPVERERTGNWLLGQAETYQI